MTSETRETFGRVGIWNGALHPSRVDADGKKAIEEAVAEIEALGYGTLWLGASPSPDDAAAIVGATSAITVATGILSIWDHTAEEVAARISAIDANARDRFVLGLGVSHDALAPSTRSRTARWWPTSTPWTPPTRPWAGDTGCWRRSARRC